MTTRWQDNCSKKMFTATLSNTRDLLHALAYLEKIGGQNYPICLFAKNGQNLCNPHSQLAKATKWTSNKLTACHWFRLMKWYDYFRINFDIFKLSIIFRGSWGSCVNWLEPKIKSPSENLDWQVRETFCIRQRVLYNKSGPLWYRMFFWSFFCSFG